jgi:hypothetical protein
MGKSNVRINLILYSLYNYVYVASIKIFVNKLQKHYVLLLMKVVQADDYIKIL